MVKMYYLTIYILKVCCDGPMATVRRRPAAQRLAGGNDR